MRHHNSLNIGFYTETLVSIYLDLVSAILPQNEITRDTDTIRKRVLNEGMSFFTKTLPKLGKSIDVSLAHGTPFTNLHSGFKSKHGTKLPSFMYGLMNRVFRDDGVPWFATWYSDLLAYFPLREPEVDDSEESQQQREREINPFLETLLTALRKTWPNITDSYRRTMLHCVVLDDHTLDEIFCLSQEARQRISLGVHQVEAPFMGDHELNQRREATVVALRALRQVCFSFYKLELPYTDEQESNVLEDFVRVDRDLDFKTENLKGPLAAIHKTARGIIRRVLCNADPMAGIPRHGPGAVATGEKLPEKHLFKRIYTRLNDAFVLDEWFFCNLSHVCDSVQELQSMEVLEAGTAKVVLVPKDSRGPRLISCEPLEYQWIQQSLMRVLVDTIEAHRFTKGRVNFIDQSINRKLALKGSSTFEWATLDMKEASDRVSCELVESLFPELWWKCLYASRTPQTQLPSGQKITLNKFAPMGSAVCFPVEALVFWALSVSALIIRHNVSPRMAMANVYVYGDDIICATKYHSSISNTLPDFGLMLNTDKCCTAGPFKESCGMDAYYGHSVTPTKIRSVWCEPHSNSRKAKRGKVSPEPSMLASYVEYSNAFYRSGMYQTAYYLEEQVQWVLRTCRMDAVPTVSGEDPSCIAFVRPLERALPKNRRLGCKIRTNRSDPRKPNYQVHEVQGYCVQSKTLMSKTYGWPFLLRKLTELEAKNRHLQTEDVIGACSMLTGQYPIAHRVQLKRAWTPLI